MLTSGAQIKNELTTGILSFVLYPKRAAEAPGKADNRLGRPPKILTWSVGVFGALHACNFFSA